MGLIHLTQNRVQWLVLLEIVMILVFRKGRVIS